MKIIAHFDHLIFVIGFRAERLGSRLMTAWVFLRYRQGLDTWEGEPMSIVTRLGLRRPTTK